MPRPTFRDAYLVEDSMGGPYVGVVRRDRAVWRIFRFGVPEQEQSREAFASREEAGVRLLEYAAGLVATSN
ncbi:hypothetical protein [Kineococcus sp. SYSU DK004]|uniref:hypothetical protein n=1 Tax=Kineococcus sp. SYSU DK004 TaxID=3383125 RepID=UPI003D7C7216